MSKNSEKVIRWRKRTKAKIVLAMGGCCQVCGYNRCNDALELHHINPEEKDFGFGRIMAIPKRLIEIIKELKKCILLCSNCHREIHAGIIELPYNYYKLNKDVMVSEYELRRRMRKQTSVINKIPIDRRKIRLTPSELNGILFEEFGGNKSALARSLKVSEAAIRKHLKKECHEKGENSTNI